MPKSIVIIIKVYDEAALLYIAPRGIFEMATKPDTLAVCS